MIITRKIVFSKSIDWDIWFLFIRIKIINEEIWELVNSKISIKSVNQTLLNSSIFIVSIDSNEIESNKVAFEIYKMQSQMYKIQMKLFNRQQRAFVELINFIHDTISIQNAIYIQKKNSHLWNLLKTLKTRLTSTNIVQIMKIETRYHRLCKRSANRDIEIWLKNWQITYTDARHYNIKEIIEIKSQKNFLMTIHVKKSNFANHHLINLKNSLASDVYDLIEKFRQFCRIHQIVKSIRKTNSITFAVFENSNSFFERIRSFTFNDQRSQNSQTSCICDSIHRFSRCFYLNKKLRLEKWVLKSNVQIKVNEQMKSSRIKNMILSIIKRFKEQTVDSSQSNASNQIRFISFNQSKSSQKMNSKSKMFFETFILFKSSSFATKEFVLKSSWILNNESNVHVCNSIMKNRFIKIKDVTAADFLIVDDHHLVIECFEIIFIIVVISKNLQKMILTNVIYVSNFMINCVSQSLLEHRQIFFDNWKRHLHH